MAQKPKQKKKQSPNNLKLIFPLLFKTQKAFVDSVDQECAISSLIYTVHISILDYNLNASSSCHGPVFFSQ